MINQITNKELRIRSQFILNEVGCHPECSEGT